MNIEELADKHGIYFYEIETLQAFADEWLALNSSEPYAWTTQCGNYLEWRKEALKELSFKNEEILPVFLANPINQELLESHKRLEEALTRLRDCDWVITLPDRMDAVRNIARDALSSIPKSVKELK